MNQSDQDKAARIAELLRQAQQHAEQQERDQAIDCYTKILDLEPKHAQAYFERGGVHFDKGAYDEAIEDFTESLKDPPASIAAVYFNIGLACHYQKRYGEAVANFKQAWEIEPYFIGAYFRCGWTYNDWHKYDDAIQICTEALEKANVVRADQNIRAAICAVRGIALLNQELYEKAKADFSRAINLAQPSADRVLGEAHWLRGVAYARQKNNDGAMEDFNAALRQISGYSAAYNSRGVIYRVKHKFEESMDDFIDAIKHDPRIAGGSPYCHMVSGLLESSVTIEDSLRDSEEVLYKVACRLFDYYDQVNHIEQLLRKKGQKFGPEIAHYTDMKALRSLVQGKSFRLYSAAYMNDPEEGVALFNLMGGFSSVASKHCRDLYDDSSKSSHSSHGLPTYIGSFVKIAVQDSDSGNDSYQGELPLWRTYGKDQQKEAAGACLIFSSEKVTAKEEDSDVVLHGLQGDQPFFPEQGEMAKSLYGVVYDLEQDSDVKIAINKLCESIAGIYHLMTDYEDNGDKQALWDRIKQLERQMLDQIRFLFKNRYYQEEKECRLFDIKYLRQEMIEQDDAVKVDIEGKRPRFYIEASGQLELQKVILGPGVERVKEWKHWIRGIKKQKDFPVEKSEIPYRN